MPNPTPSTASATRQKNFEQRVQQLQARFNELYQGQRIRYDDVITRLGSEFFISQRRVLLLLKRSVDKLAPPPTDWKDTPLDKPLQPGLQPGSHSKVDRVQKELSFDYKRV